MDKADRTTVQVAVVVLVIAGIQMLLPDAITIGPRWMIPAIEVIGVPMALRIMQFSHSAPNTVRRAMTSYLFLLVMISVLNATLLFISMMRGDEDSGGQLLLGGFGVLIINVLSFGIVYWWIDGGGPHTREDATSCEGWDFQFPQQASGMTWKPQLPDYLFTAYTNIIAFSPTDTMPLSHRAKFLFSVQSAVSLVTILVTVSRAINLIN